MDLTNIDKERKLKKEKAARRNLELPYVWQGATTGKRPWKRQCLGAIMIEKNAFRCYHRNFKTRMFLCRCQSKNFSGPCKVLQQKNSPIDLLTVVEELKFRNEIDFVGGRITM